MEIKKIETGNNFESDIKEPLIIHDVTDDLKLSFKNIVLLLSMNIRYTLKGILINFIGSMYLLTHLIFLILMFVSFASNYNDYYNSEWINIFFGVDFIISIFLIFILSIIINISLFTKQKRDGLISIEIRSGIPIYVSFFIRTFTSIIIMYFYFYISFVISLFFFLGGLNYSISSLSAQLFLLPTASIFLIGLFLNSITMFLCQIMTSHLAVIWSFFISSILILTQVLTSVLLFWDNDAYGEVNKFSFFEYETKFASDFFDDTKDIFFKNESNTELQEKNDFLYQIKEDLKLNYYETEKLKKYNLSQFEDDDFKQYLNYGNDAFFGKNLLNISQYNYYENDFSFTPWCIDGNIDKINNFLSNNEGDINSMNEAIIDYLYSSICLFNNGFAFYSYNLDQNQPKFYGESSDIGIIINEFMKTFIDYESNIKNENTSNELSNTDYWYYYNNYNRGYDSDQLKHIKKIIKNYSNPLYTSDLINLVNIASKNYKTFQFDSPGIELEYSDLYQKNLIIQRIISTNKNAKFGINFQDSQNINFPQSDDTFKVTNLLENDANKKLFNFYNEFPLINALLNIIINGYRDTKCIDFNGNQSIIEYYNGDYNSASSKYNKRNTLFITNNIAQIYLGYILNNSLLNDKVRLSSPLLRTYPVSRIYLSMNEQNYLNNFKKDLTQNGKLLFVEKNAVKLKRVNFYWSYISVYIIITIFIMIISSWFYKKRSRV